MRRLVAALALLALLGPPASATAAPAFHPGRGVNLETAFRFRAPARWRSAYPRPRLVELHRLGFATVRVALQPGLFLSRGAVSERRLRMVDELVAQVLGTGLRVVVDLHAEQPETTAFGRSGAYRRAYARLVARTAAHLRRFSPRRVALELMNEPPFAAGDWERWQRGLWRAARRAAPQHTLVLSGPDGGSLPGLLELRPLRDPNVIYTFHWYEPFAFTHQGADWADPPVDHLSAVPYPSSPQAVQRALPQILAGVPEDERDQATATVRQYGDERWGPARISAEIGAGRRWSRRHHVSVWAGELGAYNATSPVGARYAWYRDVRRALEASGIDWAAWFWWNYADARGAPDPALARALGLRAPVRRRVPEPAAVGP